jgi:hypothetical protein
MHFAIGSYMLHKNGSQEQIADLECEGRESQNLHILVKRPYENETKHYYCMILSLS